MPLGENYETHIISQFVQQSRNLPFRPDQCEALDEIALGGATITMPNGTTTVIPPRPFPHPVMKQYQDEVVEDCRKALRGILWFLACGFRIVGGYPAFLRRLEK